MHRVYLVAIAGYGACGDEYRRNVLDDFVDEAHLVSYRMHSTLSAVYRDARNGRDTLELCEEVGPVLLNRVPRLTSHAPSRQWATHRDGERHDDGKARKGESHFCSYLGRAGVH